MHLLVCVVLALAAMTLPSAAQMQVPATQTQVDLVPWEPAPVRHSVADLVQVRLDAATIERFLSSLPDLISLARTLDGQWLPNGRVTLDGDLAFLIPPHLLASKEREHIDRVLEDAGFATYEDWANVAYSIMLAAQAADFTGAIDIGSQEHAALRAIETSATLSAEEKATKLAETKSQFAALAQVAPLPGNRETLVPFLKSLRAATGD